MAERWKTSNFILFGFVMSAIVFPLFGKLAWAGSFWTSFKVCDKIWGIRVSPEVEIDGLDAHDIGIPAYNDFTVHSS